MSKKMIGIVGAMLALGGQMPEVKFSAKDKREMKDRRTNTPPRSMTPDEKEYYIKHKTLEGYKE